MSRSPTKIKIYKPHLQTPKSRNHWQIGSNLTQAEWDLIFSKKKTWSTEIPGTPRKSTTVWPEDHEQVK